MEFWEWLEYGKQKNWCTDIFCDTHDCIPMTDKEMEEWDEGFDPCFAVVRIWNDQ
jgi:hypothetical protein